MEFWLGVVTAIFLAVIFLGWVYRKKRSSFYQTLALRRPQIIAGKAPNLRAISAKPEYREIFSAKHLVRVSDFLEPDSLQILRDEAVAASEKKVRSYVPTHKKGGTVSYEQIHHFCPACLAFYHSDRVMNFVSEIVGERVRPSGDHDQSSESLLYYDETGDHIHWHFDHNFYQGRQFTALINLVNRSAEGGISASKLLYKDAQGTEVEVDTSENSFVVFEGSKVLHRASPTQPGDLRIMLSMTFNTQPKITLLGELMRRIKDTAFFGLRVLWH